MLTGLALASGLDVFTFTCPAQTLPPWLCNTHATAASEKDQVQLQVPHGFGSGLDLPTITCPAQMLLPRLSNPLSVCTAGQAWRGCPQATAACAQHRSLMVAHLAPRSFPACLLLEPG